MVSPRRAIVVGSGLLGAAIGWHLVRRGARVTVLDGGKLGGTATAASWAWIHACMADTRDYARLRVAAIEEWRRLQSEWPHLPIQWSNALVWDAPAAELETRAKRYQSWGLKVRVVDGATCREMEPALQDVPQIALHLPAQGAVPALQVAMKYLEAARAGGAQVIPHAHVRAVTTQGDRVTGVWTQGRMMAADVVVIAAGVGSPPLLEALDIALPATPDDGAFIAVTEPVAPALNGLLVAPDIGLRQDTEGRLIATLEAASVPIGESPEEAGLQAMRRLVRMGSSRLQVRHAGAARPMPTDGHPVVGPTRVAGLHVAYTHSGVTLAPLLGRWVGEAIIDGLDHPLLVPFRPGRFEER